MKNRILTITSSSISYVKEIRPIAGSVVATILMQQLDYWFARYPEGFYKFLEPCKHKKYKPGDSWTEELGFSKAEFRTAFSHIGVQYKSKKEFDKQPDPFQGKFYCSYFNRISGMVMFLRNHELVDRTLDDLVTGLNPANPWKSTKRISRNPQGRFTEIRDLDFDSYTETTNRDYRSEKQDIKCIGDAQHVCDEFELFDHHGKEIQDPEVSKVYSTCAKEIKRTSGQTKVSEKRSNGSDFSTKKEKPKRFELDEVDDRGIYVLPSAGKKRLPSVLAMRSVQVALGVEHLCVEIGLDQHGDLWMTDVENDEWHEEEEYCCNVMPYKRVIDTILGREDSTPDAINESIEFWWEYWTEFCREHGDRALKKVSPSILTVIAEIEEIRLSKVKIEDEE